MLLLFFAELVHDMGTDVMCILGLWGLGDLARIWNEDTKWMSALFAFQLPEGQLQMPSLSFESYAMSLNLDRA